MCMKSVRSSSSSHKSILKASAVNYHYLLPSLARTRKRVYLRLFARSWKNLFEIPIPSLLLCPIFALDVRRGGPFNS